MLQDETATLAEVAAALGIPEERLKRSWRRLHRGKGFPPPLPCGGWVWSRGAVSLWIAASGRADTGEGTHSNDNAVRANLLGGIVAGQQAALHARYSDGK